MSRGSGGPRRRRPPGPMSRRSLGVAPPRRGRPVRNDGPCATPEIAIDARTPPPIRIEAAVTRSSPPSSRDWVAETISAEPPEAQSRASTQSTPSPARTPPEVAGQAHRQGARDQSEPADRPRRRASPWPGSTPPSGGSRARRPPSGREPGPGRRCPRPPGRWSRAASPAAGGNPPGAHPSRPGSARRSALEITSASGEAWRSNSEWSSNAGTGPDGAGTRDSRASVPTRGPRRRTRRWTRRRPPAGDPRGPSRPGRSR